MSEKINAQALILAVLILGLTLVIGIFILANLQSGLRTDANGNFVNETLITVTETGESITGASLFNCAISGTIIATNATSGTVIPASNYTISGCLIRYSSPGNSQGFNNSNWNVSGSYTYRADNAATNASGQSVTSLSNGTPWLTIIIIVAFAVIVLGLLSGGLRKAAEGEASPIY